MAQENKQIENQPFLQYSDETDTNTPNLQHQHVQKRTRVFSHSLVLVLTSVFWITIIYFNSPPQPPPKDIKSSYAAGERHNITSHAHLLSCGTTATEARANNCAYDILLNHWVPAPCHDTEFIEGYKDDASWGAYIDANLTQKIESVDAMSEREFYYTSVRDHVNHCAEIWKKQFYAMFEEWDAFDSIVASPGHTDHCAAYLADYDGRSGNESTKVEVGFAGCWVRH